MHHPNVLEFVGVFVNAYDIIYLFTELAERGNLRNTLASPLTIEAEDKIRWAYEIASGMVNSTFLFHNPT